MSGAKTQFLRGTLDILILKVAALHPSHGYAIPQVHQGSLYPALHPEQEP